MCEFITELCVDWEDTLRTEVTEHRSHSAWQINGTKNFASEWQTPTERKKVNQPNGTTLINAGLKSFNTVREPEIDW